MLKILLRTNKIILAAHLIAAGLDFVLLFITTLQHLYVLLVPQYIMLAFIGSGLVITRNNLKELHWLDSCVYRTGAEMDEFTKPKTLND